MEIRENVALGPLTTFGVGGAARWFVEVKTEEELVGAWKWAQVRGLPLFVLGGGSNLLVRDEGFSGLVLQMRLMGIADLGHGLIEAGAGESWDGFVEFCIERGLAGVECLAGIPGSVGGTPVQNVGAYGQEVSETIESARVFDRQTGEFVEMAKTACRFRYRESLFNTDEPGRYIVSRVRFRLQPGGAPRLRYADLQKRLAGVAEPGLKQVADVVREIRRAKGMLLVEGDADCRSAGSFFKNPVVQEEILTKIAVAAEVAASDVPHWPAGEGLVKLPAAWLLEQAGFVKGYCEGAAGISTRHTLALVNRGGATFADVEQLEREIKAGVREKFGVELVREPVVLR